MSAVANERTPDSTEQRSPDPTAPVRLTVPAPADPAVDPVAPPVVSPPQLGSSTLDRRTKLLAPLVGFLQRVGRKLMGPSASTSLRRIPIFIALVVLAVNGPILNRVHHQLVKARTDRAWEGMRNDVQNRLFAASAMLGGGPKVDDGLMFVVHPKERTQEALGQTDIEPPVFKLAEQANPSYLRDDWFNQQGRSFTSFTRAYDGDTTLVALVDMGWWEPMAARLRQGFQRWLLLAWATGGLIAGIAAHFFLRPARRVLRERTDFLADAAHELRTPLSVIQASAGHALARDRSAADYTRSLAEIRSAAERASLGVTEMLDLARFDAGQAVPRLAPLRLDLLAEELAASTRVDGCSVEAEIGPSVLVQADMALIRQAIDNIVRNAASRATVVRLRCSVDGPDGLIEVIDNGPGFAAEQLPYVFERYRRGDSRGSLGLGLPIAASIVAAHGGRVDVVSPPPPTVQIPPEEWSSDDDHRATRGPGAAVTIRLPRARG